MFGKGGISNLLKQTQKMQEKMQEAQEALNKIEVEGEAGAGAVKVIVTCNHTYKRVVIADEDLLQDKEMLEDLITAALNNASEKIEKQVKDNMNNFTGGLNLPAGMENLFK